MCSENPQQDRVRQGLKPSPITLIIPSYPEQIKAGLGATPDVAQYLHHLKALKVCNTKQQQIMYPTFSDLSLYSSFLSFSGELDPERMGSGIQYGDAALRQLRSPRRAQPQGAQECGCQCTRTLTERQGDTPECLRFVLCLYHNVTVMFLLVCAPE